MYSAGTLSPVLFWFRDGILYNYTLHTSLISAKLVNFSIHNRDCFLYVSIILFSFSFFKLEWKIHPHTNITLQYVSPNQNLKCPPNQCLVHLITKSIAIQLNFICHLLLSVDEAHIQYIQTNIDAILHYIHTYNGAKNCTVTHIAHLTFRQRNGKTIYLKVIELDIKVV